MNRCLPLLLALPLGLAADPGPSAPGPADRPNILFVITDDMYPWQMNFMPEGAGRNHTPNLDRLAREGIVLRNQYVSSTVCTPSRYSCLTGRYASRARNEGFLRETERLGQAHVQWNTYADPARETTVAQRLAAGGYRTGFVGKDHMVETPGRRPIRLDTDPSSPRVREQMAANAAASARALHAAGFEFVDRVYQNNPDYNGSRELAVHNQDWITEGAVNFLADEDERPFFLYFSTTIPHGPGEPERSWMADRRATPLGWLDVPPQVQPGVESIARRAREHGVEGRETLIWFDDALGALFDALERSGKLEQTVIVFFNDHGQAAKGSIYEGGVHNPSLVWRQGGWPAGAESPALVSNIDLAPTFLDLAGIATPDDMDGRSFLPVLEGRSTAARETLFFEMGFTRGILHDGFKYLALRYPPSIAAMTLEERKAALDEANALLRDRGRPLNNEDPTKPFSHLMAIPGGQDAEQAAVRLYPHYYDPDQLYDLRADPGERVNLASDPAHAERLADLRRRLAEHLATMPGGFPL